jgi:hypothetical protein
LGLDESCFCDFDLAAAFALTFGVAFGWAFGAAFLAFSALAEALLGIFLVAASDSLAVNQVETFWNFVANQIHLTVGKSW